MFAPPQVKPKSEQRRPPIESRLLIGGVNDRLERDADRRAERALATPAGTAAGRVLNPISSNGTTAASLPVSSRVDQVVASAGVPLQHGLRQDMERRFGEDFSHVRVHTGAVAARSAADVAARAYTVGSHIVFGERGSPSDRRLLAHELAHVVQGAGQDAVLRRQPDPMGPHTDPAGARLRVRIVDTLKAAKETAYNSLLSALYRGDRAYLRALGLSSKQVRHLLNRTAQLRMMFGTAVELALEQAITADPFLRQHIVRGPQGWVPSGVGKPDWIMDASSRPIPVELTTPAEVERKLDMWRKQTKRGKPKWYMEQGLIITHAGPPAVPGPPAPAKLQLEPRPPATAQIAQAAAKTSAFRSAGQLMLRKGPAVAVQVVAMLLFPPKLRVHNDRADELIRSKLNPAVQEALKTQEAAFEKLLSAGATAIYANVTIKLHYTAAVDSGGDLHINLKDVTLLSMGLTNEAVVLNESKYDPTDVTKRATYSFRLYETEFAAREREWAEAQQEYQEYEECVRRYGTGRVPHAAGTDVPQPNPEEGPCIPPPVRPGY